MMMKARVFDRPLFWLPNAGQSVDISFTGVGDQRFRDNALRFMTLEFASRVGCGEIVAVPLATVLGNERPAKESDRQIGTNW